MIRSQSCRKLTAARMVLLTTQLPSIIDGEHLGNFFTGQFFLEEPDIEYFRKQAAKYGFDEEAYLEAVRKVPVWSMEQLNSYLFFIKGLIEVISGIGLKNLREIETREKIQESYDREKTILKTAMDGFWRLDQQGRLLEVNQAYCDMSGYSEAELLKMSISDLDANESPEEAVAHNQKIMTEGRDRFESRHRRKDGSLFDVEVSAIYNAGGGGNYFGFLRDITEPKRADDLLKNSEERLSLATQAGSIGVWDWDVLNDKLVWDDSMYRLYGISREYFAGAYDAWFSCVHSEDTSRVNDAIKDALQGKKEYVAEFRIIRPDGSVLYIKADSKHSVMKTERHCG